MNNSILFRMPIAFGAFAKHRTRILVLITAMCVIATGTLTFANTPTGDDYIKFSTSPSLSNSKPLHGSNVSGNIYVHLSDRTINSAMYFLNTNGDYENKKSITSMSSYPHAFMWKNRDGSAKPYDTNQLEDGKSTLVVRVRDTRSGKYTYHSANFTVKNKSTPQPTPPTVPVTRAPVPSAPVSIPTTQPRTQTPLTFAGDVAPGFVRWGATIGSNDSPTARHGTEVGNRMGLRRTFYQWNQISSMVRTAKTDAANNQVPWVSAKPGGSWKDHGDGKFDAQTRQMFIDLGTANGPVWYTFHHEPEGGGSIGNRPDDNGGPSEWLRAQTRISQILRELQARGIAKNVAFGPVLMGYTFQSSSGRNPDAWFKPGIWDFAGIDAYARTETTASPILSDGLPIARKYYGDRGLKIAIGEWAVRTQETSESVRGERPTAEEERIVEQRMRAMYNDILASATDRKGAQIIGAAYFDTSLNSGAASYELTGSQLSTFRELISRPTSLRANQFK